ncbi:hypothetical protein ABT117_38780 [Streptomyces sp. NPDC002262]|uniref:trypsin-like serine peptidase n=1 Tax=Streptomyces sp. NPDC002262 TaxID=3154414 RepID=UPI00332BD943
MIGLQKFRTPLLLVATACLTSTSYATAHAGPPTPPAHGKAAVSKNSALTYWTPQRMQAAEKTEGSPKKSGQAPALQSSGLTPTATQFLSNETPGGPPVPLALQSPPNPVFGKIFYTKNGEEKACSGTALASANQSTVWTAAHCIVGTRPDDAIANLIFVPGYSNGDDGRAQEPWGRFAMKTWNINPAYLQPAFEGAYDTKYDYGAFSVHPQSDGATLTQRVGGVGFTYSQPDEQPTAQVTGYPGVKYDGVNQYTCADPTYSYGSWVANNCITQSGSSGSGITININGGTYLFSNVTGGDAQTYAAYPRLDENAYNVYKKTQNE